MILICPYCLVGLKYWSGSACCKCWVTLVLHQVHLDRYKDTAYDCSIIARYKVKDTVYDCSIIASFKAKATAHDCTTIASYKAKDRALIVPHSQYSTLFM